MSKKAVHPDYSEIKITCSTCKNNFTTGSTLKGDINVDTCSSCHPFYTGSQTYNSSTGQVEKFKTKFTKQEVLKKNRQEILDKQKSLNTKKNISKTKKQTSVTIDKINDLIKKI